ncbi:neurexin-1b [Galendromus occidentalis]|uniref:Neurexin-1b n=1 Tax=Galendromus occidentalis TaxID=34638 RepID=A0AAJ7SG67_9ACAR|nr:neurexin-1b [Galendromus occidentalis]
MPPYLTSRTASHRRPGFGLMNHEIVLVTVLVVAGRLDVGSTTSASNTHGLALWFCRTATVTICLGDLQKLPLNLAMKIYDMKIMAIVRYGMSTIAPHLAKTTMTELDKSKTIFLKATLGLSRYTSNTFVLALAGEKTLCEDLSELGYRFNDTAWNEYRESLKIKRAKHHNAGFTTGPAFTGETWKNANQKNRAYICRIMWLSTLMVLSAVLCAHVHAGSEITLDGTQSSSVQFKKWFTGTNSSLVFEFRTSSPNGLLLYADDSTGRHFVEVKVIEGKFSLRYLLPGSVNPRSSRLVFGRGVADGQWHRFEMFRSGTESTHWRLDEELRSDVSSTSAARVVSDNELFLYFGGLPQWYSVKTRTLALTTAFFEQHFRGQIRNVEFSSPDGVGPQAVSSSSSPPPPSSPRDITGRNVTCVPNPCHGGRCLTTSEGIRCDCRGLDAKGRYCDKPVKSAELYLNGESHLKFEQREAIVSTNENISFYFKTSKRSGVILHLYHEQGDSALVQLRDGLLEVSLRTSGQSHSLAIDLSVDQQTPERILVDVSAHWASTILIGTSRDGRANFEGCLKKLELTSSGLFLDLVRLAKSDMGLLGANGSVDFKCQPSGGRNSGGSSLSKAAPKKVQKEQVVSFLTPDSFMIIPTWAPRKHASRKSEISLHFRTNEENGVLVYSSPSVLSHFERAFYFIIELNQGQLQLRIGVAGYRRRVTLPMSMADSQWHKLSLTMDRTGYVIFKSDSSSREFRVHGAPASLYETAGPLFVGGLSLGKNSYPSGLWSEAIIHRGFVGCLRDLTIAGERFDLKAHVSQAIQTGCVRSPPKCSSSPCYHGGICNEGWNRFVCDCSRTEYAGPTCEQPANTLRFTGAEHITAALTENQQSSAEEIVFRFRTEKASRPVFSSHPDKLIRASLEDGKFRVVYSFSNKNTSQVVTQTGYGLDDNRWHFVRILRTGSNVAIMVDQESTFAETPPNPKLKLLSIRFGRALGADVSSSFVGEIQHLSINQAPISEPLAASGEISGFNLESNFDSAVQLSGEQFSTFSTPQSFVALSSSPFRGMSINLRLRPAVDNGLLFHWAGANGSCVSLELDEARVKLIVARPDRTNVIHDKKALNDNNLHSVRVHFVTGFYRLRIDDDEAGAVEPLDVGLLEGLVYIGGVRDYNALPAELKSRTGYSGCISVEDVNGQSISLVSEAVIPSATVTAGCLESTAYEFNGNGLLLTSSAVRRPRSGDSLVLGLVSEIDNAVIVRIEFLATNEYIQIEIIDGVIFVVYNVGGEDYALNQPGQFLNDGRYHVVRFTHKIKASTLQLDDLPVQTRKPTDDEESDDSATSADVKIQVGGVLSSTAVAKGFRGILAGLVLDTIKVLDLSPDTGDIVVQGDATRLTSIGHSKYSPSQSLGDQPLMPSDSKPPVEVYERDDLVYSEGSGCYESDDDDADCGVGESNSAGDELVTAVYIPSQRKISSQYTSTTSTTSRPKKIYSCHDDEDCVEEGSGNNVDFSASPPGIVVTPRAPYESNDNHQYNHDDHNSSTADIQHHARAVDHQNISDQNAFQAQNNIDYSCKSLIGALIAVAIPAGIPEVFSVPIPEVHVPTQMNKEIAKQPPRVDTAAADGTALIIGIIAGILISIVIIALLLYRFKSRPGGSCKPNNLYYNPCVQVPGEAAPLGPPHNSLNGTCIPYGTPAAGGQAVPPFSTLHKGMASAAGGKKASEGKDPQEWYV